MDSKSTDYFNMRLQPKEKESFKLAAKFAGVPVSGSVLIFKSGHYLNGASSLFWPKNQRQIPVRIPARMHGPEPCIFGPCLQISLHPCVVVVRAAGEKQEQ